MTRLQFRLAPLHQLPNGVPHPRFPETLLHFHLLTEGQLDSLAEYYHQRPRSPTLLTHGYPALMSLDYDFLAYVGERRGPEARIGIKRRKFGRFIGLQGCETPVEELVEKAGWQRRKAAAAVKAGSDRGFWGRRGFGEW